MSIRALARDQYRAQQNVDQLEKALEKAAYTEAEALKVELRQARAELTMLKKMMSGEKENVQFRKKFSGFGT
ncbi:hypothetical protein [Desulfopila sp. IMCC35008]|uniref:hypothetical protein n=1 Tax=Desulfopila sp. IMCC35008 TaxID=2653858 RepID=UPI0013D318A4|nr:hypothetical protein [Desulfopila sp. IMCC35008]